ncbi:MAG: CARDB domain-containing protein, partial [Dehalococcoidales bacterium]|nr:CARDB domain-containing protein [Dehalococcoidales bacterium]
LLEKALKGCAEKTLAAMDKLPKGKLAVLGDKLVRTASKARIDATYRGVLRTALGKDGFEFALNILGGWTDDGLKKKLGFDSQPQATPASKEATASKPSGPSTPPASSPAPKPSTPAVTSPGKPDLTVASVTFSPYSPKAGGTLSVTFVVKNQGKADSGPFSNRVSLSKSQYGTDISMGNVDVSSLKAGEQKTVNVTTQAIPADTAGGTYWVTVFADSFKKVAESDINNNIGSAGPVQIGTPTNVYRATLQLTIKDTFTYNRSFDRANASITNIITLTSDEFTLASNGNTSYPAYNGSYQYSGSVDYYTKDYGASATWVRDVSQSGQVSRSGKFIGYARIGVYAVGKTGVGFKDASYYDLGDWSISGKNYLSGPGGLPTVETIKDIFGSYAAGGLLKDRLLNPAGETINISGRNTRDLGSTNGSHSYEYTGTMTLKIVRTE